MGAPSQGSILDTVESTILGMHSGIPPTLLTRQHVAQSINVTHRGGKPRTRPVIVKRRLVFGADEADVNSTEALFQGACYYSGFGNIQSSLCAMIGGRLFRYIPQVTSVSVQDISPGGAVNNPTAKQAWLWQGEEFLIVNNGLDLPIFFDGASTRRSAGSPGNELPAGTIGHYSNGRNVVVLPDRRSFIASDLVYNTQSGTPQYNYRDSILKTNDNEQILNGAAFAVPINAGRVNALFSVAVPDTSLGQGVLQVGTRKGVFGVDLPLDATLWTSLKQPTQVVSLPSAGPLSQNSVAVVNMDGWYRSRLGIQSFQIGRRDMGTWVQTALSSEVDSVLKYDSDALLEYASAVQFNNRLLMTCSPYRVAGRGTAHRGLIALDFHNISSLTTRSSPDYDGLWTGLPILQIVEGEFNGVDRCFIFALDVEEKICLYELLKDDGGDFDYDGSNNVRVQSSIISNALFGLEIYPDKIKVPLKELECADVFLEELLGQVDVDAKYRSDAYPFWVDWTTFNLCATACQPNDCEADCPPQYQYATFRRLPDPADTCNPATGRKFRTGYYFQLRLEWTGRAALDKMLVWARPIPEIKPGCPSSEECQIMTGVIPDLFDYEIETPPECTLEITTQPTTVLSVAAGATINLSFAYTGGTAPIAIQWYKDGMALVNGGDISGATSTALAVANAEAGDQGTYYAIVTDSSDPVCTEQTTTASVTLDSEPEIAYEDGGGVTPPACAGSLWYYFDKYYTDSWGEAGSLNDPSINPNTVLTTEEQACAKAIHMIQINEYIADILTPAGLAVQSIYTAWEWHAGNVGDQLQLFNKVGSQVCDPNDPIGDWWALSNFGAWTVTSYICTVP